MEVDPRWYEDFFDERYLAVAPDDPDRTTREVDFVVEQLGLEPGARGAAAEGGVEVEWVHADMRELDERDRYDAVVNLFTAFGYFEEEADDARVLGNVARALKPGGAFLIDGVGFSVNRCLTSTELGSRPRSWLDDLARPL